MPRPGALTRSRANRKVKTPGGRVVVHRRKIYSTRGKCALSSRPLQMPRESRQDRLIRASHSSKRPNRPYGGMICASALKREIIKRVRE
ncbi:MAG: 50S ribosomal protein L34e [Candidatus Thorarchaeota archaeon]|nr:50S ribosomal protein L34e [Candidatus Thorarchaeota archaeon]